MNRPPRRIANRLVLWLGIAISLCCGHAIAQFDTGAVVGTVTDPSGAYVTKARVTLTDVDKGTKLSARTTSAGDYEFPSVPVGTYTVTIEAAGFGSATSSRLEVVVSSRSRFDAKLSASANEVVDVVGSGDMRVDTDNNERGLVIEQTEMQNLPLNGREYADLALLAPGVQLSGVLENNAVDKRQGSFNVNGMRSTVNNFLLDGLDNNSYQLTGIGYNNQALAETLGTVLEFKIITTDYPAQYGRTGGAVVNITTISGNNKRHGEAYEYIRNSALDAYSPYRATSLIQNQFGANIGGAIQRDKMFYFLSYEGFRQITGNYSFASIPTADQKKGIFYDENMNPVALRNPYTLVAEPQGPAANAPVATIIPTGDITPFAAAVLAALPDPNESGYANNFKYMIHDDNNRDNVNLRIDRYFGSKIQTFAMFSKQMGHITEHSVIPGPAGGEGSTGRSYINNQRLASGFTVAVRSNAVLDTRFGITWSKTGRVPDNYGKSGFYQQFGIPLPTDPRAGLLSLNGQNLATYDVFGVNGNILEEKPFTINAKLNYNWSFGKHNIALGYEYLSLEDPTTWNTPLFGSDYYDGTFAKATGASTSVASREAFSLTEFMYGARSRYSLANYVVEDFNTRFHSAYVQDSWRAASKLTFNYGLRYEFTVPTWEGNGHQANYNPSSNSLVLPHGTSIAGRAQVNPQTLNFAPRFGFAYSLTPRFVARSNYGISFIQFNRYGTDGSLGSNGPYFVHSIVSQTPTENPCPTGSQSLTCFRTTMQGYPASLISPANFDPTFAISTYVPKDSPNGYLQFYSLGLQYQVTKGSVLDVAYVGTHGVDIRVLTDLNQKQVNSLTPPNPKFDDIYDNIPAGFVKFNSLQVKFQYRRKGIYVVNAFTYSQARDNAGGDSETRDGDGPFVNLYNIEGDSGISGYNQPLNDSLAANINLPSPRKNHKYLTMFFGDWRLTTVTRLTSGLPININYSPTGIGLVTDANYSFRPNITGPAKTIYNPRDYWVRNSSGTITNVLNASRVSIPSNSVVFGNSPRNSLRNVPFYNVDGGVHKEFVLHEPYRLEFRAEFFNLLNHTNWMPPAAGRSSANFGTISVAQAARELQLAARFIF